MIGLLRVIFVFAIVLMVIRFVTRYILPLLLGTYVNKKMSEMHQNQQTHYNRKREGEVTIDVKPDKNKNYRKDSGEYVDFEEIK